MNTKANAGVYPKASPGTLNGPFGVRLGGDGTVYVADVNNNRVLAIPASSKSATLVWGQSDFASDGVDQVKPAGMNSPDKVAIDYTRTPFALYVADAGNNLVLVWKDAANFHNGDPADMVVGQPDLYTGVANVDTPGGQTPTSTSLAAPTGLAVDFAGNLSGWPTPATTGSCTIRARWRKAAGSPPTWCWAKPILLARTPQLSALRP